MVKAISLRNVDLSLGRGAGRVHILKSISLDVIKGEALGLVGPSGSGKSTLLMCMAGLEQPDSGEIIIQNHDLTQMSEDQLARFRGKHIGVVFQSFHLIPTMTALENVSVPLELAGGRDASTRAAAALARVGLSQRSSHYPAEMSGGEQQRVALARAIVANPAILVADEPTGNLDPSTSVGIMKILDRINRTGTTVLMATHDVAIVDQMRKRIIQMETGHIVRDQERGIYGHTGH